MAPYLLSEMRREGEKEGRDASDVSSLITDKEGDSNTFHPEVRAPDSKILSLRGGNS